MALSAAAAAELCRSARDLHYIGLYSVLLLIRREPNAVSALLLVQILYTFMTPPRVGTVANPLVVNTLVVAGVHTATLVCL